MQRDVYAALVKKRHKRRIAVNILQLNGRITYEQLFDEVFYGYRSRRIVLLTHTAGQDPSLPRLPCDVTLPNFEVLARVHQSHFLYRLLPLKCQDVEAFAALQAVCGAAGSPFTIADRCDPQDLTFRFHASLGGVAGQVPPVHRETVAEFFTPYLSEAERTVPAAMRRVPINGVMYQGVLYRAGKQTIVSKDNGSNNHKDDDDSKTKPVATGYFSGAALLTMHETISETSISQRALMRDFAESPTFARLRSNSELSNGVYAAKHRWHMMAAKNLIGTTGTGSHAGLRAREGAGEVSSTLRAGLIAHARAKGIHMCERVAEGQYQFIC